MARVGRCALTGKAGKLVKSHLIPRALTDIGEPGEPYYEAGQGSRVQRKWSSWYDASLVTRAGEDLLADFDARGIAALRKSKLIWSAWDLEDELKVFKANDNTVRKVVDIDAPELRLFLLSLLWRAAATDRVEFAELQIPTQDMTQLRNILLTGMLPPLNFYPASFLQYYTKGPSHNRAPSRFVSEREDGAAPVFRFYFEGLVVHFYPPLSDDEVQPIRSLLVGGSDELIVMAMPFEKSAQMDGLTVAMKEAITQWQMLGYDHWKDDSGSAT